MLTVNPSAPKKTRHIRGEKTTLKYLLPMITSDITDHAGRKQV